MKEKVGKTQHYWQLVKVQIIGPYGVINHYTDKSKFTVGKKGHADISVDFLYIEDVHLEVEIRGENRIYVTDLASSRGTYIQRKKIETTIPTKYYSGCEIGMGGLVDAITISLIQEAENDKSEAALKLIEANKRLEDVNIESQRMREETAIEIANLLKNDNLEREEKYAQFQREFQIEKEEAIVFIKNQKDEAEKNFIKLQKKHTKQILRLEEKNQKLTSFNNDLRDIKRQLEEENKREQYELTKNRDFLADLNKKIEFLKESFQEDKKQTEKYFHQLNEKKLKEDKEYQEQTIKSEGQIKTLIEKRNHLKISLEKTQNIYKSKKKEIKTLEEKFSSIKMEINQGLSQLKNAEDKEKLILKKATDMEIKAFQIIDEAKDQSIDILNIAQNNAAKSSKEIVDLAEHHAANILSMAKHNAKKIISDAEDQASLFLLENSQNKEILNPQTSKIEQELNEKYQILNQNIQNLNQDKELLSNDIENYQKKLLTLQTQIEDKIKRQEEVVQQKFSQMQNEMMIRYEKEKKTLQEKLDSLNLNLIQALLKNKVREIFKYIIPSAVTFLFLFVTAYYIVNPTSQRELASSIEFSYLKVTPKVTIDKQEQWLKSLNQILISELSINDQSVSKIINIESQFLNQFQKNNQAIAQLESLEKDKDKQIKLILKRNWEIYLRKKVTFFKN